MNRSYCHPCRAARRFLFAGNATDGREAEPGKPRAFYQRCAECGHTILTLGNAPDAQALCQTVARRRIVNGNGVELDDAVAYLYWHLWRLYLAWQPSRLTFLSYAAHWLPRRLDAFIADATGDVVQGRRRHPKPHAVSDPIDVSGPIVDHRGRSRLDQALTGNGQNLGDDRPGDLLRVLGG